MTQLTTIPFAKLIAPDAINARVASKRGIDELAGSIALHGIIQPLAVRPADGADKYEVIDGRRRLQALAQLVKGKAAGFTKATQVPVIIRNEDDAAALGLSLIANTCREDMHPVDQHEAVARLSEQGLSDADIAARLAVSERTVRQRRALGALAPSVRKAWRDGKIDAKTAQAFCCTPGHAAQEAAWTKLKGRTKGYGGLSDYDVRRELAGERTRKRNVAAPLLEVYVAAGGRLTEDLFDDEVYIEDGALLKRLRAEADEERVAATRERLAGQGWAWIARGDELPPAWTYRWQRLLKGDGLTDEESERHDQLLDQVADAVTDDNAAEKERLLAESQALVEAAALRGIPPEARARSGCVIEIDRYDDDAIDVTYGVLRPDAGADVTGAADSRPREGSDDRSAAASGDGDEYDDGCCDDDGGDHGGCCGAPIDARTGVAGAHRESAAQDDDHGDGLKISQALSQTLSEVRTLAATAALRTDATLAMRVIAAALLARFNSPAAVRNEGHASVRETDGRTFAQLFAELLDDPSTQLLDARFAHAVASTLDLTDATWRFKSRDTGIDALVSALPGAPFLAAAAEHFLPDDYFKRASKAVALAALDEIREAGCVAGLAPEDVLADMKKTELAAAAAQAARDAGWLPPELRHPSYSLGAADSRASPALSASGSHDRSAGQTDSGAA